MSLRLWYTPLALGCYVFRCGANGDLSALFPGDRSVPQTHAGPRLVPRGARGTGWNGPGAGAGAAGALDDTGGTAGRGRRAPRAERIPARSPRHARVGARTLPLAL